MRRPCRAGSGKPRRRRRLEGRKARSPQRAGHAARESGTHKGRRPRGFRGSRSRAFRRRPSAASSQRDPTCAANRAFRGREARRLGPASPLPATRRRPPGAPLEPPRRPLWQCPDPGRASSRPGSGPRRLSPSEWQRPSTIRHFATAAQSSSHLSRFAATLFGSGTIGCSASLALAAHSAGSCTLESTGYMYIDVGIAL